MRTLVRGAGLVAGTGTGYRAGKALLIERGRLAAVGPERGLRGLADDTLNLGDATLLPGFVDAHTHITIRPGEGDQHGQLRAPPVRQALRGVEDMRSVVRSGVTTIRVMGEIGGIDLEIRRTVAAGDVLGPRMLVVTRALSATHGRGVALGRADGPEELRRAVRENLAAGADHIKIFVTGASPTPMRTSAPATTPGRRSGVWWRRRTGRAFLWPRTPTAGRGSTCVSKRAWTPSSTAPCSRKRTSRRWPRAARGWCSPTPSPFTLKV